MLKKLMIIILGICSLGLANCSIETPEIRGIVLDDETKQPVEGAWIHATLQIRTKTFQGATQTVLRVEPPHTRSNQKGEFIIPSKEFQKPSFPAGLGTDIENFTINASTIDDKSGGFYLKDYEGKKKIEVILNVKPWKEGMTNEKEYFSYIRALFNYCFLGRFGVEVPAVEGGCDDWELDYVIAKHERYLKKYKDDVKGGYYTALDQMADLYEKKKDYKKGIDALRERIAFIERHGLLKFEVWQRNKEGIESKINVFQKKQQKQGK